MTAARVLNKPLELDPADPLPAARLFIERHYTERKIRTLHHYAGCFYLWNGRCYDIIDSQSVRGRVYTFLETASRRTRKGKLVRYEPNMARVSNVMDAIQALTIIPSSTRLPAWLEWGPGECRAASEILSCANGLLHLPSRDLSPLTPTLLTVNSLDFPYDSEAPPPQAWLAFLSSLWGD